jgi:hypothetical protein
MAIAGTWDGVSGRCRFDTLVPTARSIETHRLGIDAVTRLEHVGSIVGWHIPSALPEMGQNYEPSTRRCRKSLLTPITSYIWLQFTAALGPIQARIQNSVADIKLVLGTAKIEPKKLIKPWIKEKLEVPFMDLNWIARGRERGSIDEASDRVSVSLSSYVRII